MKQQRCVEQLYPSNKYTIEDINKEISHKIKYYPKKKTSVQITLNENGIYIARISFLFEENLKIKDKFKKIKISQEKQMNKKENLKKKKNKYEKYIEKKIILKPI